MRFCEKMKNLGSVLYSKMSTLKQNGAFHVIFGSFLNKFVSFFGSIFIVRLLSKNDYGILSYYENLIGYFIIFAGFGLSNGLSRYLVICNNLKDGKACMKHAIEKGNIWNIVLVICCCFFCFYFPHPESFSGQTLICFCLAFTIPFIFIENSCLSALRAMFDYRRFAYLSLLTSTLLILSKILGAYFGGVQSVGISWLVMHFICAVASLYIVYSCHYSKIGQGKLEKSFYKKMDHYSFQMMLIDGLWTLFMLNDVFLLGQITGDNAAVAEYRVAYVIPANLQILTASIGVFIAPYFTKHDVDNDKTWIRNNCLLALAISIIVMGLASIVCFFLAEKLIVFLYGQTYLSSVPIMKVLLLASFINNGIRQVLANILSSIGKQKFNLIIALVGIVLQIVLDLLLVPEFGSVGLAWSSVFVYCFMGISILIYSLYTLVIKTR